MTDDFCHGSENADARDLRGRIRSLAVKFAPEAAAFRRKLHSIPEIAGSEKETSAVIRAALSAFPLKTLPPFIGTDVVALLNGERGGPNVTLRADIDALPIDEKTRLPYASRRPGFMHACGHDGHAAMLYGAAMTLSEMRDQLPRGSVRFVFQPGEEVAAMARQLLEAGAVDEPPMNFCVALHGWPDVPYGAIASKPGAVMAATGFFELKIIGRGGHGSMPENAKNPIHSASKIVLKLLENTPENTVCSVTRISGGSNMNVIPDEAVVAGTVRFLAPEAGDALKKAFEKTVEEICKADSVDFKLDYNVPYPLTSCSGEGAGLARTVAEKYLGPGRFILMEKSRMGGEDFSYFLQRSSGAFAFLGLGEHAPLHSCTFDFDDGLIADGITFLAAAAYEYLASARRE